MNEQPDKFQNEILEKIKSGKVSMQSKSALMWRTVLAILAIGLFALLAIFIASFVVFILKANGSWTLPQFGMHGLQEFLLIFPWLFVPALVLFIWLVERFMVQHSVAYKIPILYTLAGIIILVAIGSLIVLATPLHTQMFRFAHKEQLPLAGGMYTFFGRQRPDDLYVGTVVGANGHNYTISMPEHNNITIVVSDDTKFFANRPVAIGDCVEIIGEEKNSTITADSIKKFGGDRITPCNVFDQKMPLPGMMPTR